MMADIEEFYCVNCSGKTAVVFRPYAVERGGKLVVSATSQCASATVVVRAT
jgi:hypothetical protein